MHKTIIMRATAVNNMTLVNENTELYPQYYRH